MRERLFTLVLALGALAAFFALLAPTPTPPQERPTRPLSIEPGPNGYAALERWLTAAGIKPLSLRERYGQLAQTSPAPQGNLLISTVPHVYPIRTSEVNALKKWIADGNTLLVLAGLSDTPEWSVGEGQDRAIMRHLAQMTGLSFTEAAENDAVQEATEEEPTSRPEDAAEMRDDTRGATESAQTADAHDATDATDTEDAADEGDDDATEAASRAAPRERLIEPQRTQIVPYGPHPLLEGVQAVIAISEYPSALWNATADSQLLLQLAHDDARNIPSLWLERHGAGQIILSAYGSIFTNKMLGERDNARLLANITRWSLSGEGRVIIDDAHQGLVSFYDPAKFFGDGRLHRSLWWLLALWFVFVLGPRPLRPAQSNWNPVDVTGFVRAMGGFLARVLRPATAGQQLFTNFFNELRQRLGLPADGEPLWEWLAAHPALHASDIARLQDLHRQVGRRRRVKLPELHNLLVRVRGLLG